MAMTSEKVTIDMLRPGVPFYQADPLIHEDCLPTYNLDSEISKHNLTDDSEVWVCYPQWQKNPFIKKECFVTVKGQFVASIINSIPGGQI
jgi:hypothetical protein